MSRKLETVKCLTIGSESLFVIKITNSNCTRYAVSNKQEINVTKNTKETKIVRSLSKAHKIFNSEKHLLDLASKYSYEAQF